MEIKDLITYTKEYPAREAIYSDFPRRYASEAFRISEKTGDFGIVLPSGGNV